MLAKALSIKCIFCEADLDARTRPEHILLTCFGGRKTTRRAICSDCNQKFGSTIDSALAAGYFPFRFDLKLRDGKGRLVKPTWFATADSQKVRLRSGMGRPHADRKLTIREEDKEGEIQFSIQAYTVDQLIQSIKDVAAKLRVTPDVLINNIAGEKLSISSYAPIIPARAAPLGGEDAQRSMIKMLLVLACTALGNEVLGAAEFALARSVVTGHSPPKLIFSPLGHIAFRRSELNRTVGSLHNSLILFGSDRDIYGQFRLLNGPSWVFRLGQTAKAQSGVFAGLSVNPINPHQWTDDAQLLSADDKGLTIIDCEHDVIFLQEWSKQISAHKSAVKREETISTSINAVLFDDLQLKEGDILTDDVAKALARRCVEDLLRLPVQSKETTIGEFLASRRRIR